MRLWRAITWGPRGMLRAGRAFGRGLRRLGTPRTIIGAMSLVLIGGGVWCVHPPTSLITVGALLWVDLTLTTRRRRR